ncbi:MAG: TIGR03546 family protein [Nitrospiraceae bacterium]|nr:TIGR03546 family protein [Nitrospiraceae bacterium]MSR24293.1 TIGR03546 family protein [Nitrospiraceae bacterium]
MYWCCFSFWSCGSICRLFSSAWLFFSGLAYLLDSVFHRIGLAVLTAGPLEGLWTAFYNSTLWRLERFNNSIVMGSLVVSLVLFVPFYLLSNKLILKYREHFLAWVQKTKLAHVLNILRYGGDV